MKFLLRYGMLAMLFFAFQPGWGQSKTVSDYLQVNGYIKDLGSVSFVDNANTLYASSLFHNRIDLKIKPVSSFTIAVGMRNRVFISEYQHLVPDFGKQFAVDNGIVNLSFNWLNKYPVLGNTSFDRLYLDWQNDKWDVRVGRQRLNWGINITWNPNDIFNTYNFLDFDYEERPGADAAKVIY
ncbi:MAG TPA: hypothetical protein VG603_10570, partial [Chitinophagales bacterium]|nr:hypothetical protein [Chitinophagales bacterium]